MSLLFDKEEYRARVARTQAAMRDRGIDVLLVSNPANQFYLTGYDGWSFYTPQMVVVSVDASAAWTPASRRRCAASIAYYSCYHLMGSFHWRAATP